MIDDREAGTAQHGFRARAVGNPPVGRVVRVLVLDEVHHRVAWRVELLLLPELIVPRDLPRLGGAAQHRLEYEHVADDVLVENVQREERVAEVIEDAHEEHEIEPLAEGGQLVHRHLAEFDARPGDFGRKAGLREIPVVGVDAEDPGGAAPLHLDGIEAGIAADVEHAPAGEGVGERAPLDGRIITEKMLRRRLHAAKVDVVKPVAKRAHAIANGLGRELGRAHDAAS